MDPNKNDVTLITTVNNSCEKCYMNFDFSLSLIHSHTKSRPHVSDSMRVIHTNLNMTRKKLF